MQKQRSQLSIFIKRFCVLAALPMLMGTVASLAAETPKRILFFGDSLTAGYGVDPDLAYPALIQKIINTDGLNAKVVVGAVSGAYHPR